MDFILALEARYERLEARVERLEERLRRSSRNSSLPPSRDPPSAPPRAQKPASGRNPGGQPGHEGRHRPLLPLEQVDEVRDHWPERCQACAHPFVGPRLQAAVATLAVRNRVSRRDTVELADELFGVELSTAAVDAIVQRTGEALAEPYAALHDQIRSAAAVNIDETGWRTAGRQRTLWGALSPEAALFRIAPDRHQREAETLLGEHFAGIACSDRWSAYDYLDPQRRQLC